jgi:hypothetical protein
MKLPIEYKEEFAWYYMDMKGISSELHTHHIYIKEECRPIFQPERRMNPNLREIVKEELHKLLNARFIYPISDNKWVSPLVIILVITLNCTTHDYLALGPNTLLHACTCWLTHNSPCVPNKARKKECFR